ncbi:MAG TPA: phosphotransferase [Solirubrobacteraceae bacterium]
MADLAEIVGVVERALGPVNGEPVRLTGGITNRNYRVRFGGRECVLRLIRPQTDLLGIDRGSEQAAADAAAALGIAPAVLDAGPGYLVTEYIDWPPISSAQLREDPGPAARALRAFHDSGLQLPNRFWVPELLDVYARIVIGRGHELPEDYGLAREVAGRIGRALPADDLRPCHNDLLAANVLSPSDDRARVTLVDWEYAGMGHRLFDLGNLAVNSDFDGAARERLLAAYFGQLPNPGRLAALSLMQVMSDAREAAWGVVQAVISELEFDFAAYASRHFTRLRAAAADPSFEEWLRGATA